MKKKILIVGICSVAALLIGALTADQVLIAPRTVSSFSEVYEYYINTRGTLPPLPFPVADVMQSMASDDFSFLERGWQINASGGTLYLAEDSTLAKTLGLPLHLMVYEDLQRGEVVILSSKDGERYKGEALFDAPEFFSFEGLEKETDFFWEISPRRVVLDVILKSEADAWADLIARSTPAPTVSFLQSEIENPQSAMAMSVPPEHTNDIWISGEAGSGGFDLEIYCPSGVTNIEIYVSDNLISNVWNVATDNLVPNGTNTVSWTASTEEKVGFFRAGNGGLDSDSDLICDARELYVHKTDENDSDSDGDLVSDYQELYEDFTDPNNDDVSVPVVVIGTPVDLSRLAMLP